MPSRLLVFFVVACWYLLSFGEALAAVSCTVNMSPNYLSPGSSGSLTFSINNTGDEELSWVKILNSSPELVTVNSGSAYSWNTQDNSVFSGSVLPGGGGGQFNLNVSAADAENGSATFNVQASVSQSGDNPIECGNVQMRLSNSEPVSPTFSEISLGVGANSVSVGWNTDGPSDSKISYGKTTSLGLEKTSASMVLNHSLVLDNLENETTYYYRITSTNDVGMSSVSEVNMFTTGKVNSVVNTVTETVTNTVIKTTTEIKEILIRDTTPPVVTLERVKGGSVFTESPEVSGLLRDDSGVSYFEYSLDGVNWVTVSVGADIGKKVSEFTISPSLVDDGNYELRVRGYDTAGNVSKTKSVEFVIDKYPPVVGPGVLFMGPMVLYPNDKGEITLVSGQEVSVIVPESGGSEEVSLVGGGQKFNLVKDTTTGLWRGKLMFTDEGTVKLMAEARDGAGNKTKRLWLTVVVEKKPKVTWEKQGVNRAMIKVFVYDENSLSFVRWDGVAFGQKNPVVTNDKGEYSLQLPVGRYYLEVDVSRHRGLVSNIFEVGKAGQVLTDFVIDGGKESLVDQVLSWFGARNEVWVAVTSGEEGGDVGLGRTWSNEGLEWGGENIGATWYGKENWIQVSNTLLPDATFEYFANKNWLRGSRAMRFVGIQESFFKVKTFIDRGGYDITPMSDPQAILMSRIPMWTLPVNVFLDRTGKITKIKQGLINRGDLMDN